ncbi:MAG: hypothetical protein KF708_17860 [Pirellulales bacterium]|nr:hypothetical protein [Pirellulales bacterium]
MRSPLPKSTHTRDAEQPQPGGGLVLRALRLSVVVLLVVPAIYWHGGVLETESPWFISHYLDYRGIAAKVFDPHTNDFNAYQGRELSYFFDYLDAQVFRVWLQMGYPLFIATSTFLATVSLVLVHQLWIGRLLPRLPPVTSILVLLVYLTGFVRLSTDGMYYRSTKPLMVPLIVLGMSLVWYFQQRPRDGVARRAMWWAVVSLYTIGTAISLLDRMGFYLVTVSAALTAIHAVWRKGHWDVCLALMASSATGLLYNYVLGPQLIFWINGYRPDFSYQRVDLMRIVTEPWHLAQGSLLLVEQAWLGFGNYALLLALLLMLTALAIVLKRRGIPRHRWTAFVPPLLYSCLASVAGAFMLAVMVVRHPAIYDVDHRLWYYGLPIQATLLFPVWLGLNWFLEGSSARRALLVNVVLVGLVASNLLSWGRYRRELFAGEWYHVSYGQTELLRRSLQQESLDPNLGGNYVTLYYVCLLFDSASRPPGERNMPPAIAPLRPPAPAGSTPRN